MGCAQKSETKRKRTFTDNAKKQQGGWRERDTEMDNTGDEVESSRCSLADGNPVSKANKEVVDPEADAERDQRTVYVSGIPLRASREEINIFFSSVCKVRNIDLMLDPSLRVPNAVGYIEFDDPIYVSMAVDLSGQLLLGQPIEVKPLNVGNPAAEERSYIHTGKKNFLDKPWDMMTSDERIDASTNWRELTDVENRRFFYNKLTGERSWSLPLELTVARNRAHFAAQSNPFSTQHVPFTPFVARSNRQQVFGALSQVAPWPQYSACPLPQYSAYPLPQYSAYPWPQYQYQASPFGV